MKLNRTLRALFLTTSLSTVASGMEGRIPGMELMDPDRPSFSRRALGNMAHDAIANTSQDTQEFADLLKKIWRGNWASVAGIGIHQIIDSLNGQFLSRYNLPEQSGNDEFNFESFRPFIKAFREKIVAIIHQRIGKNGSYALNEATGERYPVYDGTPFQQLAKYLIPDCMPMKSIFIAICNAGPINDFLGKKLDELAISYVLRLHQSRTGKTLKEAAGWYAAAGIAGGAWAAFKAPGAIYNALTENYPDRDGSLPPLTAEMEPYSPIFDYLQPHLNHFAREALNALFLDVSQSVSKSAIDTGVNIALTNPLVVNGMKGVSFALGGLGSAVGWSIGNLAGSYMGELTGSQMGASIIGAGIGYQLGNKFGGEFVKQLRIAGPFIGGVSGVPLRSAIGYVGATIAPWTGAALGGAAGGLCTFAYAPRIVTHAAKSLAKTTKQEVDDQLKILVDYYTFSFFPLTKEEHALYGLNPTPTEKEMILYYEDYARRKQLQSESFAATILKRFFDLDKSSIALCLNGISQRYQSFIAYCLANKDATAQEILKETGLTDPSSGETQEKERDRIRRAFILNSEPTLLSNLSKFPSFEVKKRYLDQLNSFMNSLSAHDRGSFAENFRDIKKGMEREKAHIHKLQHAIQTAGERMAKTYQAAGRGEMSTDDIAVIQASANRLWETATTLQLDRLAEMLEDPDLVKIMKDGYVVPHNNDEEKAPDNDEKKESAFENYLENTLAAYIKRRDDLYLARGNHRLQFDAFKRSSLTEKLSDADIVDLLRNIVGQDIQSLPKEVQALLASAEEHPQAAAAQEKDPVSAVKAHEVALIKQKYEFLLRHQLATHFTKRFRTQFQHTILAIGHTSIKNNPSLSEKDLFLEIRSKLFSGELVEKFMTGMSEHPKAQLFQNEILPYINGQIWEAAQSLTKKKLPLNEEFELVTKEDTEATEQSIAAAPDIEELPDVEKLKVYTQNDITGYKLAEIINKLKTNGILKNIDTLENDDFEEIYKAIQENKKTSLSEKSDSSFLQEYIDELFKFIRDHDRELGLDNKLFYDYKDIIQEMRKNNQRILDSIKK
jgi:hypothetical protein